MTNKAFSKLCSKAAKIIQRDGLCKGDFGRNAGPKCAVGALRFARWGTTERLIGLKENQLNIAFRAARPRSRHAAVSDFNDAARTRKHDVVELLQDMSRIAASAA